MEDILFVSFFSALGQLCTDVFIFLYALPFMIMTKILIRNRGTTWRNGIEWR